MLFKPQTPTLSFQILLFMSIMMFIMSLKSLLKNSTYILYWEISCLHSSPFHFPIIIDPIGLTLSAIVLFISANVMLFSNMYMKEDPFITRFTLIVLAFVLAMNMLIFFPHFMTLLLGWDGLGLISFLLVIYYQNSKSLAAGMITALTNRIGDAFLLLAIAWTLNQGHWLILNMWTSPAHNILTFCIMLAAMTKSAQIPFSSWLPAAMAAPTPVSALVHSSTLVTAGVFLLIRFYPFLHMTKWFNLALLLTATLTMLMAGMSAMTECDLKKIIALSTLSQLGVMMTSLSLGFVSLTLFHLMTHALFKALLFLCAGNIIHLHTHGQDLRSVGNLTTQLPLTSSCMLIANLSLCGAPFLAGFYSKDLILEFSLFEKTNIIFILMIFSATALTAMYSMRFTLYILLSPSNQAPLLNVNEEDINYTLPIMALSFGAIMAGASLNWILLPFHLSPLLPLTMKLFTICMIILSSIWVFKEISFKSPYNTNLISLQPQHNFSANMWFLTPLSTQSILSPTMKFSHLFLKILDQSWVESITAQSPHIISTTSSKTIQYLQMNTINSFIFMIIIIIIPMLLYFTC